MAQIKHKRARIPSLRKNKRVSFLKPLEKMGLGCWGLGGDAYGYITTPDAIKLLDCAYSYGVRFFDLSNLYGAGRAEVIFGEWLAGLSKIKRTTVTFVSKAGLLPHSGFEMPTDFSIDSLRIEIQRSCKRLGIEKLPIFLLHSPSKDQLLELDLRIISEKFKSEGLVEEFGVSFRAPGDLSNVALEYLDWAELNINLMDMRLNLDKKLVETLSNKNVKVIARTPLAFGFLTERGVSNTDILNKRSHLRNWDSEQISVWRQGSKEFRQFAKPLGLTIEQLALSFCASLPAVHRVIPGAMSNEHVDINYSKIIKLSSAQLNELTSIYNKNIYYVQSK